MKHDYKYTDMKTANRRQSASPSVIEAAKVVIGLSGWARIGDGREVFQSSYMAIEVLKRAIQESENPQLSLAPEPLPAGIGGNAR